MISNHGIIRNTRDCKWIVRMFDIRLCKHFYHKWRILLQMSFTHYNTEHENSFIKLKAVNTWVSRFTIITSIGETWHVVALQRLRYATIQDRSMYQIVALPRSCMLQIVALPKSWCVANSGTISEIVKLKIIPNKSIFRKCVVPERFLSMLKMYSTTR